MRDHCWTRLTNLPPCTLRKTLSWRNSKWEQSWAASHPAAISLIQGIILHDVIDLTDVTSAHIPLGTSAQELTGDWRGYGQRTPQTSVSEPTGIAPTQDLGKALFDTGTEGFRAISAKIPFSKTLTVFTDSLQSGSSLTFIDQFGTAVHRIP